MSVIPFSNYSSALWLWCFVAIILSFLYPIAYDSFLINHSILFQYQVVLHFWVNMIIMCLWKFVPITCGLAQYHCDNIGTQIQRFPTRLWWRKIVTQLWAFWDLAIYSISCWICSSFFTFWSRSLKFAAIHKLTNIEVTPEIMKQTQSKWPWAKKPVKKGPADLATCFPIFTVPMTLDSSMGSTNVVSIIRLGITSSSTVDWWSRKNREPSLKLTPNVGIRIDSIPRGICVKRQDFIGPNCLTSHADKTEVRDFTIPANPNKVPNNTAGELYFSWK